MHFPVVQLPDLGAGRSTVSCMVGISTKGVPGLDQLLTVTNDRYGAA